MELKCSWVMSRAPNRVSFFGGGTDYPEWFKNSPSRIISTSIDKYSYIMLRKLPAFHNYKNRIVYSQIETTNEVAAIEHNVIRQTLDALNISGLELMHSSCLPGRSGMGSSSSFNIALLHALSVLDNKSISINELIDSCICLEREVCEETIGIQDCIAAAAGGLNSIEMDSNGYHISSLMRNDDFITELENSCLLIYTGQQRTSSDIAKIYVKNFNVDKQLTIYQLAEEGYQYFKKYDLQNIGKLVNESWKTKRSLSNNISSEQIDEIHNKAMIEGAWGGKLLGAGGGGFFLVMFPSNIKCKMQEIFSSLVTVPFKIDTEGSKILFKE